MVENLRNLRKANTTYYDQRKQFCTDSQQRHVGDLVLQHNTKDSETRNRAKKLDNQWFGSREIPDNSNFYLLDCRDQTGIIKLATKILADGREMMIESS
jgi:hypothetical protein